MAGQRPRAGQRGRTGIVLKRIGHGPCPKICPRRSAARRRLHEFAGWSGPISRRPGNPERQIILDALESQRLEPSGNRRRLGINRTTLYKKMKKYGIQFERQMV